MFVFFETLDHHKASPLFAGLPRRVSWLPGEAVRRFRQHAFPWEILQLEAVHWWWVQDRVAPTYCKSIWKETSLYIVKRKVFRSSFLHVCDSWFHTSGVRNPASCQFVEKTSKWPSCSTCAQNSLLRSVTPAGSAARPTWLWDFYIFGRASWHISCQKPPPGEPDLLQVLLYSITVIGRSLGVQACCHSPSPHFSPWCLQIMENIHLTENTRESDKSSKHVNTTFIFFERWKSWGWMSFITGVCLVQSITSWLAALRGPEAAVYSR